MKKSLVLFFAAVLLPLASYAEYYHSFSGGYSRYKLEAVRQLITPDMRTQAAILTRDPSLQEVVEISLALDRFVFDGLRLIRSRGMLLTQGAIDPNAIGRTVIYYNVSPDEAKAWLLASRVLASTGFVPDRSLPIMETDMLATADDVRMRLETYFSPNVVAGLMPRFAWCEPTNLPEIRTLIPAGFKVHDPIPHQFSDSALVEAASRAEASIEQTQIVEQVAQNKAPKQTESENIVAESSPQTSSELSDQKTTVEAPSTETSQNSELKQMGMELPPIPPDVFE